MPKLRKRPSSSPTHRDKDGNFDSFLCWVPTRRVRENGDLVILFDAKVKSSSVVGRKIISKQEDYFTAIFKSKRHLVRRTEVHFTIADGAEVEVGEREGTRFLHTRRNKTAKDNLENLPPFDPEERWWESE